MSYAEDKVKCKSGVHRRIIIMGTRGKVKGYG